VDFIILFLRLEPRALICDLFFSEGKYRFWVASLLRHEPELRIGKKVALMYFFWLYWRLMMIYFLGYVSSRQNVVILLHMLNPEMLQGNYTPGAFFNIYI